ncbi:family 20 glycosylhydrolase [Actinacidiphila glaucinigra]|uniref:family 20 glycosylhydrolase n=1 Tax=Actinacidiphila glaucinigra TaxID=235986 RepID=UPI00324EE12B
MWQKRAKRASACAATAVLTAVLGAGPALAAPAGATAAGAPQAGDAGTSAGFPSIPAVRSFVPDAGTAAFVPGPGSRVVAAAGSTVEDEARLLAEELRRPYASGPARPGDISLSLERSNSGPESYEMTTSADGVTVRAGTDTGVFYGTRTLLQAVRSTGRVPAGTVEDRPDRQERGLMIDIGRKYFTREWLEARVRELGDLKYNQLHLHLSDDQGFRVQSDSHPEIVSARHLSKEDIRAVVDLAAQRHITVVPEIDSPGHMGAVLDAHPDLQLRSVDGTPVRGALDISRPGAADVVDDLIKEYAPLFPGTYWHIGGDEYGPLVADDPEASFPQITAYARERYGPDAGVADAAAGWLNDRAATLRSLGKRVEAWNDGFSDGARVTADPDRVVAYWSSNKLRGRLPEDYLREGRQLLNLNSWYLYYVLGAPENFPYPSGRRIFEEWTPAVVYRDAAVPAEFAGPDRILGARLAVWCDRADAQTEDEVAAGIRMPLRALTQKLWDPGQPALSWQDFAALADRAG